MTIQRMDNVLIVVEDLDEVIGFFVELGMELEGRAPMTGDFAERVIGLTGVEQEIAMLRVPGGGGRIELVMFHKPAAIRSEPVDAPANTLGLRRIMFAVDDIEDTIERLRARRSELVGELVDYHHQEGDPGVDSGYRLCYVRGPEGIVVGLAEQRD
jgi:catechol 2,3-dioxygenase-like lactoylglutathione lyase family enzyme